jgi:hypothetical protein
MSDYDALLGQLGDVENLKKAAKKIQQAKQVRIASTQPQKQFTVEELIENIAINSGEKNKSYMGATQRISGYDLASGCIRSVLYRLRNTPINNYVDNWLPVTMRVRLGNAVHDYIQENFEFTETEGSMKINSINFSGRFDCMMGNNCLIEIKSCTYGDYAKIINQQVARSSDFYQVMAYKYILENHLEEAKKHPRKDLRTDPPKADHYNIDRIQFIYVAHDLVTADVDSIKKADEAAKALRRQMQSTRNKFAFITAITYDLTTLNIQPYMDYIENKITEINNFLKSNKFPTMDNAYVNKSACFFCKYKEQCEKDA